MGLVAILYSGLGGLMIGTVLAAFIALVRKSKKPDSSFFLIFVATIWLTVPLSAFGIFMLFVMMWS